jgi:CxxC motif-containing protein (DUF1111 family)
MTAVARRIASATLSTLCSVLAACSGAPEVQRPAPAPLDPNEWLPGGDTTNTLLLGVNAFTMPASNITAEHEPGFYTGNSFFNQSWVQAPASTEARDGLGPLLNARSCAACHFKDGRGRPPVAADEQFLSMLLRIGIGDCGPQGEPLPEPTYGDQLQPFAIDGVAAEGVPNVVYREVADNYADGEEFALLEPTYTIGALAYGPLDSKLVISGRVAPAVSGLGLLEAIPLERLEALADPDDTDGDGISGRMQRVWDAVSGAQVVGRFGWKGEQPSIRTQSAAAFLGDIGITTSLFPAQNCTPLELDCQQAMGGGTPEISDELLDKVELYARLLAVPMRATWDSPGVLLGKSLFQAAGCAGCHVPSHRTGALLGVPEVSDQLIYPYTDLLLHDMGEALSDQRRVFEAEGSEWRTPPLWGLRLYRTVNQHDRLLHDGRARGVAEAILWHGGEADAARQSFLSMSAEERTALVEFVESL